MIRLFFIITIVMTAHIVYGQSTCPVKFSSGQQQQNCKCGIKTDGQIYIYCARKQLTQLPEFTRSSILYEELILSGNQISAVLVNSFKGLRVKRLYLDNNPLKTIEPNALVELANYLEELVISIDQSQQLVPSRPTLPSRLFKSLLNLKIVKLTGLSIMANSHLTSSLFNRTRKLETIHLVDCNIRSLDINSFSGVEYSLQELNLDNNQIDSTHVIFSELERMKRLQVLTLSRNNIRRISRFQQSTSDILSNAHNDLGSNLIHENLSPKSFDLDLSFNAINHIDDYAFTGNVLSSTTKLNLNNNELTQYQIGFISQLSNLKELQLDYNKINFIPDNLFINARYLKVLSLKGNYISQIGSEYAFSGLHFNLERLNLAANKLRTIGKRVFMQTTKLKELNLERNELGNHFQMIINKYQQIDLTEFDPIKNVDLISTFEGIESELKSINLENNNLESNHLWALANLLNVESMKIGHNNLEALYLQAVKPTSKLTSLFKFYRNLTYLDIQNSSLIQLPYFIGLNRSLASFNLARNGICNVNAKNLHKFYSKLSYLNLNSNPLECNGYLTSLREWIDEITQIKFNNQNIKVSGSNGNEANFYSQSPNSYPTDPSLNWKCAAPELMVNKPLNRISYKELDSGSVSGQCLLDLDERMATSTKPSATSTHQPSTKLTKVSQPIATTIKALESDIQSTTNEAIQTVTPSEPANLLMQNIIFSQNTPKAAAQPIAPASEDTSSRQVSLLNSMEFKQTLLGSLIGAFLVLVIVSSIFCVIKSTRIAKLKDLSLCSSSSGSSKPDKSQHISSTTSSSSPYEMSKLTLQTMCINSSNSSASSGSSSSSTNSTSNSSCNQNPNDFFTKMDPLRLTLLNQASAYNQHYLNNCNLHYLASNLPYSPTDSLIGSSTTSPSQHDANQMAHMTLLNDNTYDKLHQRFNTLNMSQAAQAAHNLSAVSTLNYSQQNQLINKYIQNLNRQLSAQNGLNQQQVAETTPFLIIQNMSDFNTLVNSSRSNNFQQDQHTYHEIGEVLLNSANNQQRFNHLQIPASNSQQQQQQQQNGEPNGNELFI